MGIAAEPHDGPGSRDNWFAGFPVRPGDWIAQALSALPRGFRALHADDLHVTLAFFGPVGEPAARRGWDAILQCPPPGATVTLGPLAAFGSPRRPSAFGFDLAGDHENLIAWMTAHRDRVLRAAGTRPETRSPRPHLTMARPPRRAGGRERRAAESWMSAAVVPATRLALNRLALYTRDRKRQDGARFRIVTDLELKP